MDSDIIILSFTCQEIERSHCLICEDELENSDPQQHFQNTVQSQAVPTHNQVYRLTKLAPVSIHIYDELHWKSIRQIMAANGQCTEEKVQWTYVNK